MPRERWDALARGEDCPACAEMGSSDPVIGDGLFVADLDLSRLRLQVNQFLAGNCVRVCHRHVREPYELSTDEQSVLSGALMRVGRALEPVFDPVKLTFEILGNAVPHLRCHVKPRHDDPAPNRIIDQNAPRVFLAPDECRQRIERVRAALA